MLNFFPMSYAIENKVALVTGGAKRVGREIALTLARRGARIVLHYNTSRREALQVVREIEKMGGCAAAFQADISKAASVHKMVASVLKAFRQIDICVNNAAVFKRTPFPSLSEKDWDFHLNTNLKGTFLVAKAVAPQMIRRKTGVIINLADWAGLRPYANYIPYCVSKAGVICLTQALAKTLAPHIRVNAIAPGPVLLPRRLSKKDEYNIIEHTPLKRIGSPQDIANAVVFLIEGTDFVTGHTLMVDGGRLIA